MTAATSGPAPASEFNPAELLLWTLNRIGGADRWIDVEELYLAAFEAAPARLAWRTRPDLPDYKKCAKALQQLEDPKRSVHAGFTLQQGRYLRRLSAPGLEWVENNAESLGARYGRIITASVRQDDGRLLRDLLLSEAFQVFDESDRLPEDDWSLAEAFRCLPDSPASTWSSRFADAERAARRDARDDVIRFVRLAEARMGGRDS